MPSKRGRYHRGRSGESAQYEGGAKEISLQAQKRNARQEKKEYKITTDLQECETKKKGRSYPKEKGSVKVVAAKKGGNAAFLLQEAQAAIRVRDGGGS